VEEKMNRKQFDMAFALGFMITRDGFNGECPHEHIAPSKLRPDDHEEYTILEWIKMMEGNREFKRLREEAFLFLKDHENRGTWSDQTPTLPPITDPAAAHEIGRDRIYFREIIKATADAAAPIFTINKNLSPRAQAASRNPEEEDE
jgi:hypothetical protein